MSGPTHANQQQQAQHAPLTQQEQQVIQQLQQQQTWDLAPNQTEEDRRNVHSGLLIQQQQDDNQQLAAYAQATLPAAQAQQAAPGAPVQALAPAEKTGKQIREEQRHARSARKYTAIGDHISYNMHEQVNQLRRQQQEACGGKWEKQMRSQQADPEELRGFLALYDKHTASSEKKRIDAANRQLISSFMSQDPATHNNALHDLVRDVLRIRLTTDMLENDYLENHLTEMLALYSKLNSMQRIYQNPAHQDFFRHNLSQKESALLHAHLTEAPLLRAVLHSRLVAKGVNLDGSYEPDTRISAAAERKHVTNVRDLRFQIGTTEQELARQTREQLLTAELRLKAHSDHEKTKPEFQTLGLTGYLDADSARQLADIRELIARAPAQYAAEKPLFDRLYQQLFRATDALSDAQLKLASAERVITEHGATSAFGQLAEEYAAVMRRQVAPQRRQLDATVGLIRFLLGQQRELSAESRLVAAREQALAQVQHIEEDPQQELADEMLWASNPEALIARVQSRLDHLRFGQRTPQNTALSIKQFFIQGRSGQFHPAESQAIIVRIRDSLIAHYPNSHFEKDVTAPDGTCIQGLGYLRMINNLVRLTYPQTDEQELEDMLSKLACGTHYQYLLTLSDRTPEQQAELDTYTPDRVAELTATFQQGMQALKQFHLTHLRRAQQKYGRFQSQLHPLDFISRCSEAYFSDTCLQQDCNQLLHDGAKYFDFENNAEDQEYRTLAQYSDCCGLITQGFYFSDMNLQQDDFTPDPANLQIFNMGHPEVQTAVRLESDVSGPHLNSAEMKAYEAILRRRFVGPQAALLNGRFLY